MLHRRQDDIRLQKLEVAEAQRRVLVTGKLRGIIPGLDLDMASLQKQLLETRRTAEELALQLESPDNKTRHASSSFMSPSLDILWVSLLLCLSCICCLRLGALLRSSPWSLSYLTIIPGKHHLLVDSFLHWRTAEECRWPKLRACISQLQERVDKQEAYCPEQKQMQYSEKSQTLQVSLIKIPFWLKSILATQVAEVARQDSRQRRAAGTYQPAARAC